MKFFRWKVRNTIDEIEAYHHKDESEDTPTNDRPVGINDHTMDALRYAFSKQIKPIYRSNPFYHARKQSHSKRASNRTLDPWTGYPI